MYFIVPNYLLILVLFYITITHNHFIYNSKANFRIQISRTISKLYFVILFIGIVTLDLYLNIVLKFKIVINYGKLILVC